MNRRRFLGCLGGATVAGMSYMAVGDWLPPAVYKVKADGVIESIEFEWRGDGARTELFVTEETWRDGKKHIVNYQIRRPETEQ